MEFDWDQLLGQAPSELEELLHLLEERKKATAGRNFYRPLTSAQRELVLPWYHQQLPRWVQGNWRGPLRNGVGTLLCTGWTRVVVGDYGAYIEFSVGQACLENLTKGAGGRKYNWLATQDGRRTKVYEQLARVRYADYLPGFYYVSPSDVVPS